MDWKSEYSVGDNQLDADHREIFELINEFQYQSLVDLNDKVDQSEIRFLEMMIADLIDYTERHFSREEKHMRAMDYPRLDEHISIHGEMRETLKAAHSRLKQGEAGLAKEVSKFLDHWWYDHILKEDKAYHDYSNLA